MFAKLTEFPTAGPDVAGDPAGDPVGFVAVGAGAGVTVCCGVCGAVFCVAWAIPGTGIESNMRISGEQNRFI